MKNNITRAIITATLILLCDCTSPQTSLNRDRKLIHGVYFTLKDNSQDAKTNLIQGCHRHLKSQPGILHFAIGARAEEMQRPINVRDFDVALHIIFADKQAHDAYQKSPGHQKLVAEHKDNFELLRVFDTYVRE